MSNLDQAKTKFLTAFDSRSETDVGGIFDEGLRMANSGASKDEIRAYLAAATSGIGTRGDAGSCAGECSSQCADYPDGAPWYACYAGCYAGCISA